MAMTWASACLNRPARRLDLPWPPAPTRAMLILSLGAMCLGPPRTWDGTIVKAAVAAAEAFRKSRRVVFTGMLLVVRRGSWPDPHLLRPARVSPRRPAHGERG